MDGNSTLVILTSVVFGVTLLTTVLAENETYPTHPLTYQQFLDHILEKRNESRLYYEIYSLVDQGDTVDPPLPLLRKVVVRWNKRESGFTNSYAGWYPILDPPKCIGSTGPADEISMKPIEGTSMQFQFFSEFPAPVLHIGTAFSSDPERYHINWYCPKSQLVGKPLRCLKNLKVNIYSAYGPNNLPWHLIVSDLRDNDAPPMDDPRWVMTHDAPQQCYFDDYRGKRDEL